MTQTDWSITRLVLKTTARSDPVRKLRVSYNAQNFDLRFWDLRTAAASTLNWTCGGRGCAGVIEMPATKESTQEYKEPELESRTHSSKRVVAIGGLAGIVEICIQQPLVAWKNSLQVGYRIRSPYHLWRGVTVHAGSNMGLDQKGSWQLVFF